MVRICQNDSCNNKLKSNQKYFCSVECRKEAGYHKKAEESENRVEQFLNDSSLFVDVVELSRSRVENNPRTYRPYRDIPGMKYYLVSKNELDMPSDCESEP